VSFPSSKSTIQHCEEGGKELGKEAKKQEREGGREERKEGRRNYCCSNYKLSGQKPLCLPMQI